MSVSYEDNQKDRVPYEHYLEQFAAADPAEMSDRTQVPFDSERKVFALTLLGTEYEISWPEFEARAPFGGYAPLTEIRNLSARTFVMRYLIRGVAAEPTGRFITYGEMPWGEVYLRQFTGRCVNRLAYGFGGRLSEFAAAMEKLGGTKTPEGDISYELNILGKLSVRFILWEGDEEFPPAAQILFSDNFVCGCEAEDLCVACDIAINALREV